MPECRLFLRGLCVDPACAFTHVHFGSAVRACEDFSRCGYCAAGAACARRHEMACDERAASGTCALGDACKLRRPRLPHAPERAAAAPPPAAARPLAGGASSTSIRPQLDSPTVAGLDHDAPV